MIKPLLDPRNDYVFKRIFTLDPTLLVALINDVRSDDKPVVTVELLNPEITPEELNGKFIVLDLLAVDQLGQRFNIEMQMRKVDPWSARSSYYLARTLSNQIERGDDYWRLRPAIGIHLLDFDLFQENEQRQQAHWHFQLRDRWQPQVCLGDELQLHLIELKKADRLQRQSDSLRPWVAFIEHWSEERLMSELGYEPVDRAMGLLRQISADERERRLAFVRERAARDESALMRSMLEKGRGEGLAGMLLHLIGSKFGQAVADRYRQQITQADGDTLLRWSERLLRADRVEEIFER